MPKFFAASPTIICRSSLGYFLIFSGSSRVCPYRAGFNYTPFGVDKQDIPFFYFFAGYVGTVDINPAARSGI